MSLPNQLRRLPGLQNGHSMPLRPKTAASASSKFEATKLVLDEDEIFKEANNNQSYEFSAVEITGLPRFDDLTRYNVSDEAYDKLLRTEIRRLVDAAKHPGAFTFDSQDYFEDVGEPSFAELSNLAEQISLDAAIVNLDNFSLVLENTKKKEIVTLVAPYIQDTYEYLRARYLETTDIHYPLPNQLKPFIRHRKLYFKLLEYMTGTCIRLLVRAADDKSWNISNVALLAKLSVKLKFISRESKAYALSALEHLDAVMADFEHEDGPKAVIILTNYAEDKGAEEQQITFGVQDYESPMAYFLNGLLQRKDLINMLDCQISTFWVPASRRRPYNNVHFCAVAFEAGLDNAPIVIIEHRGGEVKTVSSKKHVQASHTALELVRLNFEHIRQSGPPPDRRVDSEPILLTMDWVGKSESGSLIQPGEYSTHKLDDVISMLCPLALCDPFIPIYIEETISRVNARQESMDPMAKFKHPRVQARCSVQSGVYLAEQRQLRRRYPDTVTIAQSGLIKGMRAGTLVDESWAYELPGPATSTPQAHPSQRTYTPAGDPAVLVKYRKDEQVMRQWIFNTTSVIVRCRGYVLAVLSICATVIAGGLAASFTVGTRISGVDPFQLATFAWLVVGVILITAKSRYVTEWPWHDFLHGQVVCRSVRDLADVSGVDKQMILAKLLSNESTIKLTTKGPYNGMFGSKLTLPKDNEASEGFSIDVPVKLSTMIASGFVVLKVVSENGEHLIVLDARKDIATDYAEKTAKDLNYLCCLDIPSTDPEDTQNVNKNTLSGGRPVVFLARRHIGWNRLIGLCTDNIIFG